MEQTKVTIRMDKRFVGWWESRLWNPGIKEDEITKLIAWMAWREAVKQTKAVVDSG